MKLILCADDKWGMAFGGRRQSRDTVQRRHMLAFVQDAPLWMSPYSAKLFAGTEKKPQPLPENIVVCEDAAAQCPEGAFCFCELEDLSAAADRIEAVFVYHWNRSYPATLFFPAALKEKLIPVRTQSFRGSSHDNIVFEEYRL